MNEKTFQLEIKQSINHFYPDAHYEKIPDLPRFKGSLIRYPVLRPYDAYLVLDGNFYALEYKMQKTPGGFAFNKVSDKQIEKLQLAKRAGGQGLFLINCRYQLSEKQMPKDDEGDLLYLIEDKIKFNFVILLDVEEFIELKNASNKKSLGLDFQLEQYVNNVAMERKGKYWNIVRIIDCFGGN